MDSIFCRVCLQKPGTVSLFSKETDDANDVPYSTKVMRVASVLIGENDGLPSTMCGDCTQELAVSYRFVLKCEASDKVLRCIDSTEGLFSPLAVVECKQEFDAKSEIKFEDIDSEGPTSNMDTQYYDADFTLCNAPKEISSVETTTTREPEGKVKKKCKKKSTGCGRSKTGPVECNVCGFKASSKSALASHLRTHTGERPFVCETCNATYRTRGGLKRHQETHFMNRERKFTCETCGNSFFRKHDIITHMRVHTGERPYVCQYCPKRFRQVTAMARHHRMHTGEKNHACPICDKKFGDRDILRKHQNVHSNEKKFQCHLCDKLMKTRTALNVHLNLHLNKKQNICTFCGMAFNYKGNLQTHMKRVHSEKSGHCTICMKPFSDITVHMRTHTGERPFVCQVCDSNFATKRSLSHHMLYKHDLGAKFKCSIGDCTKKFPTATMLEFHLLKQHTNHTPYVCEHCARGFFRPSDLSRHLRVSHMDIPKTPIKSLIYKIDTPEYT